MKKILFILSFVFAFILIGCDKGCDHQYEKYQVHEVACTTDGYTEYKCIKCNDIYYADVVHAKGHEKVVTKEAVAVTCETVGYTAEYTCNVCHRIVIFQESIAALGHNYNAWIEVKKPTVLEEGLITRTCKNDSNHVEEFVLPKLISTNYEYNLKNPTCISEGLETFSLTKDGQTFVYELKIDKIPHNYIPVVTNPTCTLGGYTTHTCDYCKDTYQDSEVAALGHSYNSVVTNPTCEDKGFTTHTCHCGDSYIDAYVDELGHSYTTYVSNNDALCEADGTKTAQCDNGCGKTDTLIDEGSALGHNYQSIVIAPTCEAEGYTKHVCQNDNTHFYTDTIVDPIGHSFTTYVSNNDALCEIDGTKTAQCDNGCGKTDTLADEGSALGHNYQPIVIAPTCEEEGYTKHVCQNDNTHFYTDTIVDPIGHSFTTYVSNNDALCEADGTKTAQCDNGCGKTDTLTDEGSALGHNYQSTVIAPTCEEEGYTKHVCQNDNTHVYTDTIVDPIGHSYTNYVSNNDATCLEDGTKTANCNNGCGKTDTLTDTGSALGHTFLNYSYNNDATCKENGTETSKCDLCNEKNTRVKENSALGHTDTNYDYYCDRCSIPYGDDVIMISTYEDLLKIKEDTTGFYQLAADIDMTGMSWDNNFTFFGYLYGDGYSIKGLPDALFYYNNGIIDSLVIKGSSFSISESRNKTLGSSAKENIVRESALHSLSVFVIKNSGTIKNCEIKGTNKLYINNDIRLTGEDFSSYEFTNTVYFGGFASENTETGIINNCNFAGTLELDADNYSYHNNSWVNLYNGEHNTSSQNIYLSAIAAINKNEISNCKITGRVATYFKLHADWEDAYINADSRANAYTNIYYGAICASNAGNINNIDVLFVPTVTMKDGSESSSLKGSNLGAVGQEIILKQIYIADYKFLIGESSGTITGINTNY